MFGVTVLGNNSAIPAFNRHPTAQVVCLQDELILIDCGEGTQMQIAEYKVKRSRINHILISHLHGDHYFGLIGLITSMGLLGRQHTLHVYGPQALETILQAQLQVASTTLPYPLHFHPLENDSKLFDGKKFSIESFPTKHRVPCWGFIISEKKVPRKINKEAVLKYEIPSAFYETLKMGEDYQTKEGQVIKNELLTIANSPCRSYAYCADTIYDETLVEKVKNVSLLYHETTYLKDLEQRAAERFHSTTVQAAAIAKMANTGRLIIGHFSSKYNELDEFLAEAIEVFPQTELALEGATYRVLLHQ
jgi:ribonuclease Z